MKFLLSIAFLGLLFFSCNKDKTPTPCTGVEMSGERTLFVGTWHWYSTTVEEWFDVGPSNYFDYNPQNQGFEYYFTVSPQGRFQEYRNDSLVASHILDSVEFEIFNGTNSNNMLLSLDCTSKSIDLRHPVNNLSKDSINTLIYPFNFDDQANHLKSLRNYFVKE